MKLVLALVCDDAGSDAEGRLEMRGVFHDLYAPGFPAKQDRLVLVVVLEWDREDRGRFRFRVDLLDPADRPTLTVDGHTEVDPRGPDQAPARTRLIMPVEEVVFPEPGPYRFRIRVKGRELDGPTLHLVRAEPRPEPAVGVPDEPPSETPPDGG